MVWESAFPTRLLTDVVGIFPTEGLSRAEVEAVIDHAKQELREEDPEYEACWRPDEVVLAVGRVLVLYCSDRVGEEVRFFLADLSSDNGKSFTAGELYYKLYREVADKVRTSYHHWFEGLELVITWTTDAGPVPVYRMWLGN